jgi:hypothetical protein
MVAAIRAGTATVGVEAVAGVAAEDAAAMAAAAKRFPRVGLR